MTNELEKQFFDTFGIEPNCQNTFINPSKCPFNESRECCDCVSFEYPQITDRILLELICILNNYGKNDTWAVSVENLKDCILMNCIKVIKEKDLKEMPLNNFKHQVRTLFEEG